MVTKRFLERKFLNPWLEKREAEAKEAKADIERGRRVNRYWADWNRRRMEANARGESFDEPPPDIESIFKNVEYY